VVSSVGGTIPVLTLNDTVNVNTPVVIGSNATTPILINNGGLVGLLVNSDGSLTVPAGATPGTYNATYQICYLPTQTPVLCDTAIKPITVSPSIQAINDGVTTLPSTGGNTPVLTANDTVNGGAPAVVGTNVSLPTLVSTGGISGLTVNPDGSLAVPNGTAPGVYTVTYQICYLPTQTPTLCSTATKSIGITPTIQAINDVTSVYPAGSGGKTPVLTLNDTVNGTTSVVIGTNATTPNITNNGGIVGLVANSDGTLSIPAATPKGTYVVTYQICYLPTQSPALCATATKSITISPSIQAVNDGATTMPSTGGKTPVLTLNDTIDGTTPVVIGTNATAPIITNNGGIVGLLANPDGTLTVPAGTPSGPYAVTYQICYLPTQVPALCSTATKLINVALPTIQATNDAPVPLPSTGGKTPVLTLNDTVNGGTPVVIGTNANPPTIVSNGGITGLVMNPDGTLTIPNGTTPGNYSVVYQICYLPTQTPVVCSTATIAHQTWWGRICANHHWCRAIGCVVQCQHWGFPTCTWQCNW
jgi:hypothetical protein